MSSVYCICSKKLWSVDDGQNRQTVGLCEFCVETNNATLSPHWVEDVVKEPIKVKEPMRVIKGRK